MHLGKSPLFAAASGAIALTIVGLSWPAGTTTPEAVSSAAEHDAPETTKTITLAPASSHLVGLLPVPYSKGNWFSLPSGKGALVLFVPRVASDRIVVVRDEMGRLLDFADAKSGLPLLRQYRLDPGIYQ